MYPRDTLKQREKWLPVSAHPLFVSLLIECVALPVCMPQYGPRASPGAYMCSGALMLMRVRQFARTILAASHSLSRAFVISSSPSMLDTTRHSS